MNGSPTRRRSVMLGVIMVLCSQAMPQATASEVYISNDRDADLYIVDPQTGAQYQVTSYKSERDFDGSPSWFPAGRIVAYNSFQPNGGLDIFVRDIAGEAAGGREVNFTNNGNCNCGPAWSPDGRKIAFHGTNPQDWRGLHVWRWSDQFSGGSQTSEVYYGNQQPSARNPTWSPDSARIAYTAEDAQGATWIFTLNYDESHEPGSEFTIDPLVQNGEYPDWSPLFTDNNTWIAFSGTDHNIYVVRPDKSQQPVQITTSGLDIDPSWSPDGTRLAFTSYRDGNPEIYVVSTDGSGLTRLTNNPGFDGYPAWNSADTRIVYSSERLQAAQASAPTVYRIADYEDEELPRGSCRL